MFEEKWDNYDGSKGLLTFSFLIYILGKIEITCKENEKLKSFLDHIIEFLLNSKSLKISRLKPIFTFKV